MEARCKGIINAVGDENNKMHTSTSSSTILPIRSQTNNTMFLYERVIFAISLSICLHEWLYYKILLQNNINIHILKALFLKMSSLPQKTNTSTRSPHFVKVETEGHIFPVYFNQQASPAYIISSREKLYSHTSIQFLIHQHAILTIRAKPFRIK